MRPTAQKSQHAATRLAACRVEGTKTEFFFSFVPASPLLEVSTAQGLSSEMQSENKMCLSITQQLCLWSQIDPEASHVETIPRNPPLEVHGTRPPVTFKSCFIFELSRFPLPTNPAEPPMDHLISSSHTFLDFPFLGKNKTKPNIWRVTFQSGTTTHRCSLAAGGSAQPWCCSSYSHGMLVPPWAGNYCVALR